MTNNGHTAPLALTCGELGGVGPLLTAKLWLERKKHGLLPFLFVGPSDAFSAHGIDIPTKLLNSPADANSVFETALPIIETGQAQQIIAGELNVDNAAITINSIEKAVSLCTSGSCSAMVTNPIHKATLYSSGFDFAGHTDFLEHLTGVDSGGAVMMLATDALRVIPATIHIPLKDVASTLTADNLIQIGVTVHASLRNYFGIENPKLAYAGLNPHAGEDGTIGLEEGTHIIPALRRLKEEGIRVTGPHPADTLFHSDARDKYDVAITMYHDQALIPLKTLDFYGGVNVTLGLPIIRTSPDHGTALERAKEGTARIDSLLAAIRMAQDMVNRA